jgi:hypothetical protein
VVSWFGLYSSRFVVWHRFRICLISLASSFLILHFCGWSIVAFLFDFIFLISFIRSFSVVLVIIVLVSARLLKCAKISVLKFLSSSCIVSSFSVFIAWVAVRNFMFSFPVMFLNIMIFVSMCLSSRPLFLLFVIIL